MYRRIEVTFDGDFLKSTQCFDEVIAKTKFLAEGFNHRNQFLYIWEVTQNFVDIFRLLAQLLFPSRRSLCFIEFSEYMGILNSSFSISGNSSEQDRARPVPITNEAYLLFHHFTALKAAS